MRTRRSSLPNLENYPKTRISFIEMSNNNNYNINNSNSNNSNSNSNKSIGISSKLFRVVSQSDENSENDEEQIILPELPDLDITSDLEKYSQSNITSSSLPSPLPSSNILIENPLIEEAMTMKIKPTNLSNTIIPTTSVISSNLSLKNNSNSSVNYNNNKNHNSENDEMDNIWKMLQEDTTSNGLDGNSNVRVAIRMRPLNSREIDLQAQQCIQMIGGTEIVVIEPEVMQEHRFNFDFCFDTTAPDTDPSAGNKFLYLNYFSKYLKHNNNNNNFNNNRFTRNNISKNWC